MNIVVLDGYTLNPGDLSWKSLEKFGTLKVYDRTAYDLSKKDLIIERAKDAEIVFTNKTPISKEILDELPKLRYIGVLATGYNIIDINAAKEKGIVVTNIPTYGTDSVAQMVFAHILNICHHVSDHNESVKRGDWANNLDWCYWNYPLIELAGKTIGIIGFGRIGRKTAEIAQAFGMKVIAYNTHVDNALESDTLKYVSLDELFSQSDIISLHCPLIESTKGIINKNTIAKMKDGVIIINTSRGQLIVEEDLAAALNNGKVYAAGLDVVSTEPIKEDNPLLKCKNAILTPHIAWAPKESRQRLMNIAVNNLEKFLSGNPVNVVNK